MNIITLPIDGSYLIEETPNIDNRGFFTRMYCKKEFKKHNIKASFVQTNLCLSTQKKTTRGLHYQKKPYQEEKLIRCIKGTIFDVIVDLRPESKTYLTWYGEILSEENKKSLLIPKGCAHGYQTLSNESLLLYHVSQYYNPLAESGIYWNDPVINIDWPYKESLIISKKDKRLPQIKR